MTDTAAQLLAARERLAGTHRTPDDFQRALAAERAAFEAHEANRELVDLSKEKDE